jgi:hypothetical protein
MKSSKVILVALLLSTALMPSARGQKCIYNFQLNLLKERATIVDNHVKALGDSLTGIVDISVLMGNRDRDAYAKGYIISVEDDNGNVYENTIHSEMYQDRHDEWVPLSAKFITQYNRQNAVQGVVLPTSVKHLKSARYKLERIYAYSNSIMEDLNCPPVVWKLNNIDIIWMDLGYNKAKHPAEYYFSKKRGAEEIVKGTPVERYRGRTTMKKRPLIIHLLGAVGNRSTGDVCFIFSITGNGKDEEMTISTISAFDENGAAYNYQFDWTNPVYRSIGSKYGCVEMNFTPFRVPVGTPLLQKVKMASKSKEYLDEDNKEYEFEWKNVPIQWVNM